jgi:acetyl-CoA carboxylase biotin carboxylase subunit
MNTRVQVEHPVTNDHRRRHRAGTDPHRRGRKLRYRQRDIELVHAIECRINAEDPFKFIPSPGRITAWHVPGGPGIRVDSHAYSGYFVPPNYDSMVGK